MTEEFHQLSLGHLRRASAANVIIPAFAAVFVVCLLLGYQPTLDSRAREFLFFAVMTVAAVAVNQLN